MCKWLYNFLQVHKILYEFQFGFRKHHSTILALMEVLGTAGYVDNRRQPGFPGCWSTDMERSARRRDFSRIVIHLPSAT